MLLPWESKSMAERNILNLRKLFSFHLFTNWYPKDTRSVLEGAASEVEPISISGLEVEKKLILTWLQDWLSLKLIKKWASVPVDLLTNASKANPEETPKSNPLIPR